MPTTLYRDVEGLHQDTDGLCGRGTLIHDGDGLRDRWGGSYRPDGEGYIAGWFQYAGLVARYTCHETGRVFYLPPGVQL